MSTRKPSHCGSDVVLDYPNTETPLPKMLLKSFTTSATELAFKDLGAKHESYLSAKMSQWVQSLSESTQHQPAWLLSFVCKTNT